MTPYYTRELRPFLPRLAAATVLIVAVVGWGVGMVALVGGLVMVLLQLAG